MGNKYIQNKHNAPITVRVKDPKTGEILVEKKLLPELVEKWSGKQMSTGFTAVTEAELKLLEEGSKTFQVYRDKHKLLVVHDELPPEAKSPHEALVDARKESRKLSGEITALKEENEKLKASLFDAEKRYKDLFDASGSGDVAKPLNDRIAELEAEVARLTSSSVKKGGKEKDVR